MKCSTELCDSGLTNRSLLSRLPDPLAVRHTDPPVNTLVNVKFPALPQTTLRRGGVRRVRCWRRRHRRCSRSGSPSPPPPSTVSLSFPRFFRSHQEIQGCAIVIMQLVDPFLTQMQWLPILNLGEEHNFKYIDFQVQPIVHK